MVVRRLLGAPPFAGKSKVILPPVYVTVGPESILTAACHFVFLPNETGPTSMVHGGLSLVLQAWAPGHFPLGTMAKWPPGPPSPFLCT